MRRRSDFHARRGLTLVELLVATGLVSLIVIALVRLVDTSLSVWSRTETRRDVLEHSTGVTELLAADFAGLEGGARGDLLVDWIGHDLDADGIAGLFHPQVRLVRRMSSAELARTGLDRVLREALVGEDDAPIADEGALLEVVWTLAPSPDGADGIATLLRSERLLAVDAPSAFEDVDVRAVPGLQPVSGSVLWFAPVLASQTSDLTETWSVGPEMDDCALAWDARGAGRLDVALTVLNRPAAGMPPFKGSPLLPRRVRLELEIERPADLVRRTTLRKPIGVEDRSLVVRDPRYLPRPGAFVRVDEEWMEVTGVSGDSIAVERGVRGTRNTEHGEGARLHFGERTVRDVRIDAYREDWNL